MSDGLNIQAGMTGPNCTRRTFR